MTFYPIVAIIIIFIMIDGMSSTYFYLFKSSAYLGILFLYELGPRNTNTVLKISKFVVVYLLCVYLHVVWTSIC